MAINEYAIKDAALEGFKKGFAEGFSIGFRSSYKKMEYRLAVVNKLLLYNKSIEEIADITELSVDQIKSIKQNQYASTM